MAKPTILREKVYIPSASEYDTARRKYLAFMGAKLSKKARNDGAYESNDYKTGYFFLRSPLLGYNDRVYYGYRSARRDWDFTGNTLAGLRVAFNLIYNPECDLVRGCRMETRKALVWNPEKGERETVESTAPIIKFGKYDCIWLNKEECEAAYAKGEKVAMQFWTLDLVAKAEPFDEKGDHNDYAKAEKLRAQCKKMFTKKELDQMVEVEMSSEDGYEKATPILETEETTEITETSDIHKIFELAAAGKLDIEELRTKLKEVVASERQKTDASAEKAQALFEEFDKEFKWLSDTLEKKKQKDKAYDELLVKLDNIKIGGEHESE